MASAGMDPNDVYRYHTRYVPTVTIINHSKTLKREGKYDENFKTRSHDSWIIDLDAPREAAQLLALDLEITAKNYKEHRVTIISSPYKRCLQTATLVAQEMNIDNIQVYYDFGEAVAASRDAGWDFAYEPLVVSQSEMQNIVSEASRKGEQEREDPAITIGGFLGREVKDLNENDLNYFDRVSNACGETAAALEHDGDHMVVIAHATTIKKAAMYFIGEDTSVFKIQDCGYMTITSASDGSSWISGRSRSAVKPVRAANPNLKIGHEMGESAFSPPED